MKKLSFTSLVSLLLVSCQGAYNTSTSTVSPVLDEYEKEKGVIEMQPVLSGGILMHRTDETAWEAPEREVDKVKNELTELKRQLSTYGERIEAVDLKHQTKSANQKQEVRKALQEMENERLRQASYLTQELSHLKDEKENLINALDKKFMEVEESNLYLTDALVELKDQQSENFLKQLEIQSKQETLRRQEMLAMLQKVDQKNIKSTVETEKQKAILEERIAQVKEKLFALQREDQEKEAAAAVRRARLSENVEKKLIALKETYDRKLSGLERVKAQTENKLVELNEKEILKLQEQTKKVREHLSELKGQEKIYADDLDQAVIETQKMKTALTEVIKAKNILQSKLILDEGLTLEDRRNGKRKLIALASEIKEKEEILKERKAHQTKMAENLTRLKEKLRPQVELLVKKRENLAKELKKNKVDQVISLRDKRTQLTQEIDVLMREHKNAVKEAKHLRTALEQRRYDYEKARRFVKAEDPKTAVLAQADVTSSLKGTRQYTAQKQGRNTQMLDAPVYESIALKDYEVVIHVDQKRLKDIVKDVVQRAEPFTGPWQVKWKLKPENQDVTTEKFSLDVESKFSDFADYLSTYMKGYRGFGLTFNMFNEERVLVITDDRY